MIPAMVSSAETTIYVRQQVSANIDIKDPAATCGRFYALQSYSTLLRGRIDYLTHSGRWRRFSRSGGCIVAVPIMGRIDRRLRLTSSCRSELDRSIAWSN